jgi:DNA (cytosine-5)-methyltransferase 1
VVLAVRRDLGVDPAVTEESLQSQCEGHPRTVRWAIGDLEDVESGGVLDTPSVPTPTNAARIKWLFDNDAYDLDNTQRPPCHQSAHSYVSMYGRLAWDEPAQTVTTGFGSMGQGRYVHPSRQRTITAHEAARLQMLPDFFDFGPARCRSAIARMIGNAVPPILGIVIGALLLEDVLSAGYVPTKGATGRSQFPR